MIGRIIGKYTIVQEIGNGGFSRVYRAEGPSGEIVAIKVLKEDYARDPSLRVKFETEASVMIELSRITPNICKCHEMRAIDDTLAIVMELMEGETLKDRIEREGKVTDMNLVLRWSKMILDALKVIHRNNFVHRDIKPANIFVTRREQIKLFDFGILKNTTASVSGVKAGTYGYSSPEQFKNSSGVDYRSDYYAFGATLYTILTGEEPDPVDVNYKNIRNDTFRKVIERLTYKDKERRYSDINSIYLDLGLVDNVTTAICGENSKMSVVSKNNNRIPNIIVAVVTGIIVAVAMFYFMEGYYHPQNKDVELGIIVDTTLANHTENGYTKDVAEKETLKRDNSDNVNTTPIDELPSHSLVDELFSGLYEKFNNKDIKGAVDYSYKILELKPNDPKAGLVIGYSMFIPIMEDFGTKLISGDATLQSVTNYKEKAKEALVYLKMAKKSYRNKWLSYIIANAYLFSGDELNSIKYHWISAKDGGVLSRLALVVQYYYQPEQSGFSQSEINYVTKWAESLNLLNEGVFDNQKWMNKQLSESLVLYDRLYDDFKKILKP